MTKAIALRPAMDVFTAVSNPNVSLMPLDALRQRDEILERARAIERVAGETSNQSAMDVRAELQSFDTQLETWRVAVKKPFFDAGKRIDADAAKFGEAIEAERVRLKKLCDDFAKEQARIAEAERKRQAAELARLQEMRRQAEAVLEAARLAEEQRAREAQAAEEERQRIALLPPEPLQPAVDADTAPGVIEVEATAIPQAIPEAPQMTVAAAQEAIMACDLKAVETLTSGVPIAPIKASNQRTQRKWKVEVKDVAALYRVFPLMVDLSPRMRDINSAISKMSNDQPDVDPSLPGCVVTEEYNTSPTRR